MTTPPPTHSPFPLQTSGSTDDFLRDYEDCHETPDDTDDSPRSEALLTMDSLIERISMENLHLEGTEKEQTTTDEDEEVVQTPPPSPTEKGGPRPSLFSLAQVSSKLGELWSSARESIFGEDYWIPSDPNEIVFFPQELLRAHKVVYPQDDSSGVIRVVQGSMKNRPGVPLHHVVLKVKEKSDGPSYSIFRTNELDDAVDLCLRCHECQFLFTRLEKKKDARKHAQELIKNMKAYPLWRMIPIAIASNREDIFSPESIQELNREDPNYFKSLCETMAQPEGKYPLHIAIEMHRLKIARRMLEEGCDPAISDLNGNNALHYASLASVQMIELLWDFESSHKLLNRTNNEGCAPVTLAIRNANPRCLATLLSYGAEMSIRVAGRNPLFEAMQSKGKNTDIIKAILEASPDLLKERDSLGNTALHAALYKTPLMGLLYLKGNEIDLNAKNYAGQAALHLYTVRGEIGLIITLASYNCNIDEEDSNGNTALHMAVSKRNTEATKLLLCLGANPNKKNSSGDTPRHLAARVKHTDILRALILCGAERCNTRKTGCVNGCVSNDMLSRIKSGSQIGEEVTTPRSNAVHQLEDEEPQLHLDSHIHFHTQEIYLSNLVRRLEELASRGERPKNMVNLLSMDGGGIRGLVIIQTMIALEETMGEPIFEYFDWVAGTSTGALVSAALAQGKTVRQCQHIYLRFKDLIFDGWTRPYNSLLLETFMKSQIGEESLAEILEPRMMLTTVRADTFPVRLELMRNYKLPVSDEENKRLGFGEPAEMPVWKALRCTSAAPMFFSPVDDKYIDGGIISNNPCLDLLGEVQLYNGTMDYLNRPEDKVEVGMVMSMGTGQIPQSSVDPLHVEFFNNPISSAFALKSLSLILVDQVTATEGAPVDRSLAWCNTMGVPFFRLSAPLWKDISLGTKDDHDIAGMMWDCIEYAHSQRAYLRRICDLLKQIGKRSHRGFPSSTARTRSMQTQTSSPSTPVNEPNPLSSPI